MGDTLFATIRPSLRRVAQVPVSLDGQIASTAFCVLRPNLVFVDQDFLFFATVEDSFISSVSALETGASYPAVRDSDVLDQEIALPPVHEQQRIVSVLRLVRKALLQHIDLTERTHDLKAAAMRELFTLGLRSEPQKETGIGLVPGNWEVCRLDQHAKVVSTRMSYTELESSPDHAPDGAIKVLGIKVSDMNSPGNECEIRTGATERPIAEKDIDHYCAPPGTIVFPKRGAAIATNKKRLTAEWSVFDPNVIGVVPETIDRRYLFHWFQMFDLRSITEPGPTPQLNKKHLEPLLIPVPIARDEQVEIAQILDTIDHKIDLHRRKRALIEELFKSLLHKLMTGEVCVADLDLSALPSDAVKEARQ
jgi:type I restriction enzyme S subunit